MSDSELERITMRKVTRRFVPILFTCFVVAFLDRVNIGFAALTMNKDLGLSSTAFGLGAGLFFLTYFLLEVPSNLALERFGARRWIARIMFTWGLLSAGTAFVRGEYSFYAVRMLLGASEAGFFPGVIFFLTLWVPVGYRARVVAVFMAAMPVASVIGSPVSGLLTKLNGLAGFRGWQWMFLIEAFPALVLTVTVLMVLSDKPSDASWLSVPERDWLKKRLDQEPCQISSDKEHRLLDLLRSPMIVWLGVAYFGITGFNYGLSFFLPQIVKQMGLSIVETGFVSAIPFAVATIGMAWWGRHSDRVSERRFHLLLPLALAAVGLAGSTFVGQPVVKLALLCLAAFGVFSALPIYWTVPTTLLAPSEAAAGIALVNSLGNLSGFVDPYAIGAIKDLTGSFSGGLQLISVFGLISLLILTVVTRSRPGLAATFR
jgi:D-galactonate transporter